MSFVEEIENKTKEYMEAIEIEARDGEILVRCPVCGEILTTSRGWSFIHCGEKHIIRDNPLSFALEEIDMALESLRDIDDGYTMV